MANEYTGPLSDSLANTDSGDGDDDTQTNAKLCYIFPDSQQMFEDSRVDRHQCPLADILNSKAHKDVATTHKAPRHRNSVVETGVEEFDMVDVSSGRTVVSDYVPTVKQLPEITDSNENPISCLHHGGGT